MDPITSAIVAALSAGVAKMAGQVSVEAGKLVVKDAYEGLKSAIRKKFGPDSPVDKAIKVLEQEPDFKPHQDVLAGRIAQAEAASHNDLLKLVQTLTKALEQTSQGRAALTKYQIHIQDSQVGVVGDKASIEAGLHFGSPPKKP